MQEKRQFELELLWICSQKKTNGLFLLLGLRFLKSWLERVNNCLPGFQTITKDSSGSSYPENIVLPRSYWISSRQIKMKSIHCIIVIPFSYVSTLAIIPIRGKRRSQRFVKLLRPWTRVEAFWSSKLNTDQIAPRQHPPLTRPSPVTWNYGAKHYD